MMHVDGCCQHGCLTFVMPAYLTVWQVPAWDAIRSTEGAEAKFQSLFVRVLQAYTQSPLQKKEEGRFDG